MHPRNKIVATLEQLSQICQTGKHAGESIVLTSGCFDLLHGGHLEYICDASEFGPTLVVGINSDVSVRALKGASRPVRGQDDRAFTLAGFSPVDWVVVFDSDDELITAVKPDIYVASSTSHVRVCDDRRRFALLTSIGTRIIELGATKNESTTDIIRRFTNQ